MRSGETTGTFSRFLDAYGGLVGGRSPRLSRSEDVALFSDCGDGAAQRSTWQTQLRSQLVAADELGRLEDFNSEWLS